MKVIAAALAAAALLGCRAASGAPARVPDFDHVIVVVFENKETGSVLGNGTPRPSICTRASTLV